MKACKSIKALAAALTTVVVMAGGAFAQQGTVFSYVITKVESAIGTPGFKATIGTTQVAIDQSIQTVIDAIKTDANSKPGVGIRTIAIQFGDGTNVLDIGHFPAYFVDSFSGVATWGNITISGKITSVVAPNFMGSPTATVVIERTSVTSTADIANTNGGPAIGIGDRGTVKIIGGTVATSGNGGYGHAVDFDFIESGAQACGSVILGGSPTIGNIRVSAGKLSVATGTDAFAPAGKQYTIRIDRGAAGNAAVVGGASFAGSFILTNSDFSLAASGNDLVLYDPTTSIITKNTISEKQSGISVNGTSLRLVGAAQVANIRIYNLNGKLLLSRSATPNEVISVSHLPRGTYVVKALGNSVRMVRF